MLYRVFLIVLHALKERYQLRDPYTYSGIVLVSLAVPV